MNKSISSPYLFLNREKWASLRETEPMTLSEDDLKALQGINEELSMDEIRDIYLPLSRLLNFYKESQDGRQNILKSFLNEEIPKIPFVIGIAGSVSVGKSTTARVLQALLSRRNVDERVALVTTDGFLFPNAVLEEKGLMLKKGYPQSYDTKRLTQFVSDIKSGKPNLKAPVYSHFKYDVLPNGTITIDQPDILILEGLNVLQSVVDYPSNNGLRSFVSDYVDFSIYVDAEEDQLEDWYLKRFMKLRNGAFTNPKSYFNNFTYISDNEALLRAKTIWREINLANLKENILPTRERASLILHKADNHSVDYVKLRK